MVTTHGSSGGRSGARRWLSGLTLLPDLVQHAAEQPPAEVPGGDGGNAEGHDVDPMGHVTCNLISNPGSARVLLGLGW